jgi:6-carboxyhexanoate--CoA ligase
MTGSNLWSVRMRASSTVDGTSRHLSGAERLVQSSSLDLVIAQMLARAKAKNPRTINITVDAVDETQCCRVPCLPVRTVLSSSQEERIRFVTYLLKTVGIHCETTRSAFDALFGGLNNDGLPLRGASLWDRHSGKRLESDRERGVRTSRFDYSQEGSAALDRALGEASLTHFRTREAVAVATKTSWAGVLAELCWSDEPDYTTGYVATKEHGYVRLPDFKPLGSAGGRIFFVDTERSDLESVVAKLENEYVLIEPPILIDSPISTEAFLAQK